MKAVRPKLSLAVLVLAGMAAFAIAGHVVATRFIHDQQARQLDELTDLASHGIAELFALQTQAIAAAFSEKSR